MQRFVSEEFWPGPQVDTDEGLLEHAKRTGSTTFHQTSTCMMGTHERSVVDTELRVHGMEGLRVIDASVMPTITSGNTNAPTMMIAEKGAALLREDAKAQAA
jgi:choline dehydrogenase